ncbi:Sensor histidine kinase YehU [Burkholderia sp. AD24]|nr:Sensor histidine kinase YehU [Burkholderia sp. AD24]
MNLLPTPPRWLLRTLRVTIPTTVGSAWLYSTIYEESFMKDLMYAFLVVSITQALIVAGRHGLSHWLRKRFPENLDAKRNWPGWGLMAPWIIGSLIVGYFAGVALGDLLTGTHREPLIIATDTRMLLLSIVVALVPAIGINYFLYARARMAAMEIRTQAALRTAAENRLKLLESQLEPHMLFNTLANLRVLIGHDAPRAQGMLDHLIAYLRATLEASRTGLHPLSTEFERISDYLALMQIRMGSRLQIRLELPAELAALPLPPLLLQPLVENAIKHGLEPKVKGGRVEVTATLRGASLILSVRDTGVGLDALPEHGARFGLQQVRERLEALYGHAGQIELIPATDKEGGALVTVTLPYQR